MTVRDPNAKTITNEELVDEMKARPSDQPGRIQILVAAAHAEGKAEAAREIAQWAELQCNDDSEASQLLGATARMARGLAGVWTRQAADIRKVGTR
jgi:hypothetical protein